MVTDHNQISYGDHFELHRSIQSLCCIPGTNIVLYFKNKQIHRKIMEAKIEKMHEMFNKDLEELKNKQTEMNNTITEMKTVWYWHINGHID